MVLATTGELPDDAVDALRQAPGIVSVAVLGA